MTNSKMTAKEAIETLLVLLRYEDDPTKYLALKMSIIALETAEQNAKEEQSVSNQQTDKQSDKRIDFADCISRQAAIDELGRWLGYLDEDMIERIRIGIKKLPSAQPESKTCVGCVYENQKGWCIDVCGGCVRNAVDHYEQYKEETDERSD